MASPAELIKEKLDIVEYIKGYLPLQQAGKNFKALCPFHREKTASFMVSPERQTWHCFGCNLGGDAFTFLMRHENVEFSEALRMLAEKTGVELRRVSPAEYKYTGLLYEINEKAKEFFKKELARFQPALDYLTGRGLKKETIEEFELGWAPNQSDAAGLYLLQSGFSPDDILRAGLTFKSERGLQIDRFRGRIMFPIHGHTGKIVGFTGRLLPQFESADAGKYVNSPETSIFSKSRILYGLHKSKNFIREKESAVVVEGQTDFLMSWQAGIKHIVASSGTALTPEHLNALRRLTDQIILSFDNDEAGHAAGERAIDLAEANDFIVKVVLLKDAKDIADVAENNPESLEAVFKNAQPAPEFYFERYLGNAASGEPLTGSTPSAFSSTHARRNLRIVLAKLRSISSAVERSVWVKELSKRTGIEEKALLEDMDNVKTSSARRAAEEDAPFSKMSFSRQEFLSQCLLAVGVEGGNWNAIEPSRAHLAVGYDTVFDLLKAGKKQSDNEGIDAMLNLVVLRSGQVQKEDFDDLKKFLSEEHHKGKRHALAAAVKRAEERGDDTAVNAALKELNDQFSS